MNNNFWHHLNPLHKAISFIGMILVGNLLAGIILLFIYGLDMPNMTFTADERKFQTFLGQIFGFLIPVIVFYFVFGKKNVGHFYFKSTKAKNIFLTVFVSLASLGIIGFSGELNMMLFDIDHPALNTLKELELKAKDLMESLIIMDSYENLVINILLIGVTPAIVEELAFRGVLQSQFAQTFKNTHLAIWLTAFIFSAIHFQFFGFLPRFLLGAVFGYLVIYSGSIIPAVIAHFLNNSLAVVGYYVAQHSDLITEDQIEQTSVPWIIALASLVMTLAALLLMRKSGYWPKFKAEYEAFPKLSE